MNDDIGLDPSLAAIATLDVGETPKAATLEFSAGALDATRAAMTAERIVIVHGKSGMGRRSLLAAVARVRAAADPAGAAAPLAAIEALGVANAGRMAAVTAPVPD